MDTTLSKKWDIRIKSILLLLLSIFMAQIVLSNSFISGVLYLTPTSSSSYFFSGFYQFTENNYSPLLFIVSYYLLSPKSNDIITQSCIFVFTAIFTSLAMASNNAELNAYLIHALLFFSVMLISCENIFSRKLRIENTRYIAVLFSGIIHGSLFAHGILNINSEDKFKLSSLFLYSSGLITGLLFILSVLYILIAVFAAQKEYYKKWVVNPLSILILLYAVIEIANLLVSKN